MSTTPHRRRVAVLISGRGSNMQALVAAASDPAYPVEIVLVLSNKPNAAGLAFDALTAARADGLDLLLVDTAGRLHNKSALMEELRQIPDDYFSNFTDGSKF
jgi:phosphoribosylglycinamide formyltransferase-1